MGRIVVTEFISLDGVIDSPGGGDDYTHAGWTFEFDQGEGGQMFKLRELMEAEAQLLGRVTYDGFAAAWPTMEGTGEFGEKMNAMPKYVASSTLTTAEWTNTTILRGEVAAEVSELKRQIHGVILVAGSAQLVQALIAADLVDELRLMVFPIVLGSGKRLFAARGDKWPLTLTASETVGDGLEILTYQPGDRA
ncbi:MAG: dihydrofolate reductase family protein [Solirubrobacteraceae bacterium]